MVATIVIYIQDPKSKTSTDAMLAHIYNQYLDTCARDATLGGRLQVQPKIVRSGPSGGIVDQNGNATPAEVKSTPMIFDGTNPTLPGTFVKAGNTSITTALELVRAFGVPVSMAALDPSFAHMDRVAPPMPPPAAPAVAVGYGAYPPSAAPAGPPSGLPPPHPGIPASGYGGGAPPYMAAAPAPSPFLPGTPDYLKGEICDDVGNVPSRGNLGGAAITVGSGGAGVPDMAAMMKEREASMARLQAFMDGGGPPAMPGAAGGGGVAPMGAGYAAGGGPGRLATVMPPPDSAPASGRFAYGT